MMGMICSDVKFRYCFLVSLIALALAGPGGAQDFWADSPGLSPKAINEAIARSMVYISTKSPQAGAGLSECYRYTGGGAEALLVLAQLEAGEDPSRPELAKAIDEILKRKSNRVFSRAIRTALLCELVRNSLTSVALQKTLPEKLQTDVDWLVRHQLPGGGWGEPAGPGNTNDTAEVLRALQAASDLGAKINPDAWKQARLFLQKVQNSDGGFGYFPQGAKPARLRRASNGSATAAGASALKVLLNHLNYSGKDEKKLQRALAWLDRNYSIEHVPAWNLGAEPLYSYLYDLACATGQPMRLGGRDVDVEISTFMLAQQQRNGAWPGQLPTEDNIVSSAWAIRTLRRIQPAPNQHRHANNNTQQVISVPGDSRLLASSKPERFLVIGGVALPGGNTDFASISAKLSDALAKAISIGVRHQDFYPNDTQGERIPRGLSMLWLTGKTPEDFQAITSDRIRAFVQTGGILLIDSVNGNQSDFDAARANLVKIFGQDAIKPITTDDPLITGNFGPGLGSNLNPLEYNTSALKHLGIDKTKPQGPPLLWAVREQGRIVVVLSRLALAGPAGGDISPQNPGYIPSDARRIVLNVLLYANSGRWRVVSPAE